LAHNDSSFAGRALKKAVDSKGVFIEHVKDDHRHDGVEGAWIRYVSGGNSGYRLIFLRRDPNVYVYRAGEHRISEDLTAPKTLANAIPIVAAPEEVRGIRFEDVGPDRFLRSIEARYFRTVIAERTTVPHRSLTFISPQVSFSLLSPTGLVGGLFERVIGSGGSVTLITKHPKEKHLDEFDRMAARRVNVLFHETVNARLSLFEVDREELERQGRIFSDLGVIGSIELLESSFGTMQAGENRDELCYEMDIEDLDTVLDYCIRLTDEAVDLPTMRQQLTQ
jgi:hypothetical protein